MTFFEELTSLVDRARGELSTIDRLDELDAAEIRLLGRKGELTFLLRQVSQLPEDVRKQAGLSANTAKTEIESVLSAKRTELMRTGYAERLHEERIDVTEPGERARKGHLHLVSHAIREITDIFARAGFVRTRYPEVEWDWYAFEALNMDKDHPARDEWETFFVDSPASKRWGKMILTPHGTSGTARDLARNEFPLRAINIQKTYRRQMDMTHLPMFHQFDGVYVDENVSIAHLLGILDYFVKSFFGPNRKARVRPFHFRFTEPSFEVDVSCGVCLGTGELKNGEKCRTCKRGWVEMGGAGMLHPNVLTAAGIDPERYSGLAFGWGVERNYMMKEGLKMDDIRVLYGNDLRFLQQF